MECIVERFLSQHCYITDIGRKLQLKVVRRVGKTRSSSMRAGRRERMSPLEVLVKMSIESIRNERVWWSAKA